MAMNWPTFFTRLGSAVVFAAVMMCGLLWKDWMFVVLVGVIQVLCLRDYFRLMEKIEGQETDKWISGITQLASLVFQFCVYLFFYERSLNSLKLGPLWPVLCLMIGMGLLVLLPILIMLYATLSDKQLLYQCLRAFGGFVYISLPCLLLIFIRFNGWQLPLILILCIWMNDTMAYIVGSFIGKTPFSKISPKKTWEGTVGGALLTVIGAAVAAHFIPDQSMALYIALALCAAIAGTAGDLFESKLKRMAGVKDSGTLMPGHGGALDRFDSLLVATPFAFCAVYLLQAFAK